MEPLGRFVLAAAMVGGGLLAQRPDSPPPVALRGVHGITAMPAGWVGVGDGYKAWFTPGAMAFTPALGDSTPSNQTLQWSLVEVRRGDTVIHRVEAPAPAERVLDRIEYAHPGYCERYEVRADGVEQSFLFAGPLAGTGDLVVRGRIRCSENPTAHPDGSISWVRPESGGTSLGKVVGVDADGRTVPGSLRVAGDHLELVLPGSFVAAARFPLLLDPLFAPTQLASGSHDAIECDIGQTLGLGTRCYIAWSRRYSTADTDVYGCWTQWGTASVVLNPSSLIAFEAGPLMARRPRVGSPSSQSEVLVVWQESSGPLSNRDLVMAATTTAMFPVPGVLGKSATVPVAATSDDERDAEVTWERDSQTTGGEVTVLYRDSQGLHLVGAQLPLQGAPVVVDTRLVPASSSAGEVAISRSADANGRRLLVFQQPGPLSQDLVLHAIDADRDPVGVPLTLGSSILDESMPAVDGQLLAFARRESTLANAKRDVLIARIDITGAGPNLLVPITPLSATSDDEYAPTVARTSLRYCVAYVRAATPFGEDVHGTLVEPDCTTCNTPFVIVGLDPNRPRELGPRLAGAYLGVDPLGIGNRMGLVLLEVAAVPPFASQVLVQEVLDVQNVPDPISLGGGCGGGIAGWAGEPAIGNRGFAFELTNGPVNGLHFCGLGLPGAGIACGGCVFTAATSYALAGSGGSGTHAFPIPCTASLAGFQLETQWLSLATASPCAVIADIQASNRLLTTIGN